MAKEKEMGKSKKWRGVRQGSNKKTLLLYMPTNPPPRRQSGHRMSLGKSPCRGGCCGHFCAGKPRARWREAAACERGVARTSFGGAAYITCCTNLPIIHPCHLRMHAHLGSAASRRG
uniref:Uncharacterized protein n=1 Tax=Chrysotila carterae TaxID=13221 RepID=A0A7S4B7X8_CHRCT|eukprot:6202155-Pleurochrysis_carterae.AAC.1